MIYSIYIPQPDRIRPGTKRIFCFYKKVSCANIGRNHVICPVMRIITYGWGEYTPACVLSFKVYQLRRTIKNMTDLLPVYKVEAVKYGNPRIIYKSRSN